VKAPSKMLAQFKLDTLQDKTTFFIKVFVSLFVLSLLVDSYSASNAESRATDSYIAAPKIDDIYFLDFRVLSDNLRPRQKYRLAKVVDITGEIITLRYGNVFFWQKQSLIDSIRYGQISYSKYFEPKRYDFNLTELNDMRANGAIFKVKRPELNVLYGSYVNTISAPGSIGGSQIYIPGKRENLSGLGFLKSNYIEDNFAQAFERFSYSAEQGYSPGQINLAQMYINGQFVDKDFDKALYWLKLSSLQSDKAGILKYVIICQQLSYCDLGDFYQELTLSGVNIKVREHNFKLSHDDNG
tara:strand:+ start:347 stop:1240 length:894 start_codon:yes stop_codon:yes gene_type:complete